MLEGLAIGLKSLLQSLEDKSPRPLVNLMSSLRGLELSVGVWGVKGFRDLGSCKPDVVPVMMRLGLVHFMGFDFPDGSKDMLLGP